MRQKSAGFRNTEGVHLYALISSQEGAHAIVELLADDAKHGQLAEAQDADLMIREVKDAVRRGTPLPKELSVTFYTRFFSCLVN